MKRTYGAPFFGTLAVAAIAMMATPAFAQIKIGSAGPMTGQYAAFGEQLRKGATMAVEEINAAGGVNGQKLELLIGDEARQALVLSERLRAGRDRVHAGEREEGDAHDRDRHHGLDDREAARVAGTTGQARTSAHRHAPPIR